jgi:hypothetical protein
MASAVAYTPRPTNTNDPAYASVNGAIVRASRTAGSSSRPSLRSAALDSRLNTAGCTATSNTIAAPTPAATAVSSETSVSSSVATIIAPSRENAAS